MEEAPITVGLIMQVVPVLTGLALLWLAISRRIKAEFDLTRSESEAGRARLHQRIDRLEEDMDRNFVRRTEHQADMRGIHRGFEERDQLIRTLIDRLTKEANR